MRSVRFFLRFFTRTLHSEGPLLKTMVDDLNEKATGGLSNRTFHIYSGHDTVRVNLTTLEKYS